MPKPPAHTAVCPTCGVDAPRAMIVAALLSFYSPEFRCPRCGVAVLTLQAAAEHMASHEPDLVEYVARWLKS